MIFWASESRGSRNNSVILAIAALLVNSGDAPVIVREQRLSLGSQRVEESLVHRGSSAEDPEEGNANSFLACVHHRVGLVVGIEDFVVGLIETLGKEGNDGLAVWLTCNRG